MTENSKAQASALRLRITGDGIVHDPGSGGISIGMAPLLSGKAVYLDTGQGRYRFTVQALAGDQAGASPAALQGPSLSGEAVVGTVLRVTPGLWSGSPEPTLAYVWLRDGDAIDRASEATYLVAQEDDGRELQCRVVATNGFGVASAATGVTRAKHIRPVAKNELAWEVFDQFDGVQSFDASVLFEPGSLAFSIDDTWAEIDARTGIVSIPTGRAVDGREIRITAENSGGFAAVRVVVTVEGAEFEEEEDAEARIGFAGASVLQIVVNEARLTEFERQVAEGAKFYVNNLDPKLLMGGAGTLDGVEGTFSGDRNRTTPQLFTRYAEYAPTAWTRAFAVSDSRSNGCPADSADGWIVSVNGKRRRVADVHRKTVPSRTKVTSAGERRQSTRRHVVSLTFDTPFAPGDAVSVQPPAEAPLLEGTYRETVVSEAIHVCQLGYPVTGPKKGYVGLWLGQSGNGASASTNAFLSPSTKWSLVGAEDGVAVASGGLSLAKRGDEKHNQWADIPNYNGCDIYEADFSAFQKPGRYRLIVAGVGASTPFPLSADPYADAFRMAARAYFLQRSGCEISAANGEGIVRPRNGHPEDGLTVWQSTVKCGRTYNGFTPDDPFGPLGETPTGSAEPVQAVPKDWGKNLGNWLSGGKVGSLPVGWTLSPEGHLRSGTDNWSGANLILSQKATVGVAHRVTIDCALPSGYIDVVFNGGGDNPAPVALVNGLNSFSMTPASFSAPWFAIQGQSNGFTLRSISISRPGSAAGVPVPNAWGGWHDAADWDRRPRHADAVYVMADMVEKLPVLRTFDLNLPESGKPFAHAAVKAKKNDRDTGDGKTVLPDLIHEALWGLSIWRRTQRGDGAIFGGVEYSREVAEGSVSWNPILLAYAYDYEEWAAYKFAMAAAKLGHVIRTVCGDAVLGKALVDEAVAAWDWAEGVLATGIDAANGAGGDPNSVNWAIMLARLEAAPVVYRAASSRSAKLVFESYNTLAPQSNTGLPAAGQTFAQHQFWHPYHYTLQSIDYWKAGREGRSVIAAISTAIHGWASKIFTDDWGTRLGTDYGLHATDMYGWGEAWYTAGPASGWKAARWSCQLGVEGAVPAAMKAAAAENLWFALGCNPSNASFVPGLGTRSFSQPLYTDFEIPGMAVMGVAAGALRWWELDFLGTDIFPKDVDAWPKYTQIFESQAVIKCSEFDLAANTMQWLYATGFAVDVLRR